MNINEILNMKKDDPEFGSWYSKIWDRLKKQIKSKDVKSKDFVPLKGTIHAYKVFSNGTRELAYSNQNLIVLAAKQKVLSSIYSTSYSVDPINTLSVGIGGTVDPGGLFPLTPLPNAVGLYNYLLSVSTSYTVDNTIPQVTFIADLDEGTGNGSLITEAGLFTTSGVMFNIKTFPGIMKSSEFALHFEWTIEVA